MRKSEDGEDRTENVLMHDRGFRADVSHESRGEVAIGSVIVTTVIDGRLFETIGCWQVTNQAIKSFVGNDTDKVLGFLWILSEKVLPFLDKQLEKLVLITTGMSQTESFRKNGLRSN